MSKHKSEKETLSEIIENMGDLFPRWWEVMGIEIPGMESVSADDFDAEEELESAYLQSHRNDLYLVSWPEHVINPHFDSDANYQLIQNEVSNDT